MQPGPGRSSQVLCARRCVSAGKFAPLEEFRGEFLVRQLLLLHHRYPSLLLSQLSKIF